VTPTEEDLRLAREWLSEWAALPSRLPGEPDSAIDTLAAFRAEARREAEDKLARVMALHFEESDDTFCEGCGYGWPCPTARACGSIRGGCDAV